MVRTDAVVGSYSFRGYWTFCPGTGDSNKHMRTTNSMEEWIAIGYICMAVAR